MKKYVLTSVFIAFLGGVFLLGFVFYALSSTEQRTSSKEVHQEKKESMVQFGDTVIRVDVVSKPEDRNKGLSGREKLEKGKGMLFIFDEPDTYSFWMPDMKFAIDIVWIDERLQVVHIEENVTPESYPKLFTPEEKALYVLEVPSGYSKEKGITLGSQAIFRNIAL